jgi:phosphoesterase RecJ-like protein
MYFPEEAPRFRALIDSLRGQKVAVLGHMRPDGDCIGSQVAMCRFLIQSGIDAVCVNRHAVPRTLKAFVGDTPFLHENDFTPAGHRGVSVDCADLTRIGAELLAKFPEGLDGNIDHHLSNTRFAKENIIVDHTAAAAHLLAGLAFDLGLTIDAVTAQALYVGIATDTGQFRFQSTTPDVLEIAARLVRLGASPADSSASLYEQDTFGRLDLLGRFLKSLQLHEGGRLCSGEIPLGTFEATGTTKEDTEGLVDYPRCIEGVDVAVLMEDLKDGVKGSLRAKDSLYRLDLLAKKLNGGGHALAAGFNLQGASIAKDKARILGIIADHIRETDAARDRES